MRLFTALLLLAALQWCAPLLQGPVETRGWGSCSPPAFQLTRRPSSMCPLTSDFEDGCGMGSVPEGFGWTPPDAWQLPPAQSYVELGEERGEQVQMMEGWTSWSGEGEGEGSATPSTNRSLSLARRADSPLLVTLARGRAVNGVRKDFGGCCRAKARKFTCGVCSQLGATRGVLSEDGSGTWDYFVCKRCVSTVEHPTGPLVARCRMCPTIAIFGQPGASRKEGEHCMRHKLPGEVNLRARSPSGATPSHPRSWSADADFLLFGEPSPSLSSPPDRVWDAPSWGVPGESVVESDSLGGLDLSGARKRSRRSWPTSPEGGKMVLLEMEMGKAVSPLEGSSIEDSSGAGGNAPRSERSEESSTAGAPRAQKDVCEDKACFRVACFGVAGDERARACERHRAPGDVMLRCPPARRCQSEGCASRGRYGEEAALPGGGPARGFCARHKAQDHVMLHVARCKGRDAFRGACRKQASFGGVGDSVPRFCSAHRRTADVYLRHGTCTAEGCATIASFGAAGGGTRGFKFCGRHKEEGDVNLRYQQQKAVVRRKREERHRESEWLMQHLDLDGVAEGGDRLSLPPSLWDPSPLEEDGGVAASPRPPAPLEHPHPHSHSREQEQEPSPPGKLSALDACSGAFPPTNDHAFARDPSFPPPAARARAGDQLDESTLEEGLSDSSGSRGTPPPLSDVRGGSLSCGASLRSRSAAPRGMFAAGCAV